MVRGCWIGPGGRGRVGVLPPRIALMLYSALDSGNFLVIPGSPEDVWTTEWFSKTRSKNQAVIPVMNIIMLFWNEISEDSIGIPDHKDDFPTRASIIYMLEEELTDDMVPRNSSSNSRKIPKDFPAQQDRDILREMKDAEKYEQVDMEELKERVEKDLES
ncbi:hypothetical protein MLD38_024234 [Melastoma candidum]|uniref:Uncharacterized protein n=1 Tax=Melastoma candidum TaxID=119954 RepID=A0ACB9NYE3_9MYRT|nr:hypothetical protein MLD38_024234 [Melastoma candidum]